jgi:hypothetical protein
MRSVPHGPRSPRAPLAASLLAVAGLASAALGQTADPAAGPAFDDQAVIRLPHVGCGKACFFESHPDAVAAWQPGQMLAGARLRGPGTADPTDVLNNALDIEVSPPGGAVSGSNTMTIRSNVAGLTSFTFRLRNNMAVSTVPGAGNNLVTVTDAQGSYTTAASVPPSGTYARTITLARPIAQGATFTVRVDYSGTPVALGLGNWYAGPQLGNAANPGVVTTLSQPYYAGTWWPCKDGDVLLPGDNLDRATMNISVTAPSTFQSVSNGVLLGVDALSGGRSRYRWATAHPLPTYLAFISTSVYTQWQRTWTYPGGTMPVHFSLYPASDNTTNRQNLENVVQMLTTLSGAYGTYPFADEKYGIYEFEFNGGMEHATYTGQGANAFGEDITAHELGHQWWGDYVTCRTWSDIWLNEGFATYTEALWAERKPGSAGLPALRAAMNARRPSSVNGSVYVPAASTNNVNRIFSSAFTYDKAAWVIHALRHVMGDATFFNFLQTYRATYGHSAATTADFTALASAAYGSDLSWFFNPWLYQVGAPQYEYAWQPAVINGQNYLRLSVSQVAQSGVPLFPMPLDVRVTTASGDRTVVVFNDAARDDYLIPLSAAPTAVTLDPDDWVLTVSKTAVAYTPGPPKIVSISPAPGSSSPAASAPSTLVIGFSDPVTIAAGNVSVMKAGASVPFGFAYDAATMRATLTFAGPLGAGTYDVAVSDAVVAGSGASARALDGELATNSAASLPSGNGEAGGAALFSFTVLPAPCRADYNGQNGVDLGDIFAFLTDWFAGSPRADFNQNGSVELTDIFSFLNAWFAGC